MILNYMLFKYGTGYTVTIRDLYLTINGKLELHMLEQLLFIIKRYR